MASTGDAAMPIHPSTLLDVGRMNQSQLHREAAGSQLVRWASQDSVAKPAIHRIAGGRSLVRRLRSLSPRRRPAVAGD
jgi:hypothetical protein